MNGEETVKIIHRLGAWHSVPLQACMKEKQGHYYYYFSRRTGSEQFFFYFFINLVHKADPLSQIIPQISSSLSSDIYVLAIVKMSNLNIFHLIFFSEANQVLSNFFSPNQMLFGVSEFSYFPLGIWMSETFSRTSWSTADRMFALHVASPSLIPRTPYSPLNIAKNYP